METREIKFRAWDGKYQIMTSGVYLSDVSAGFKGLDKGIVMQYTGLKDKNGKEIYEGDIVTKIHKLNLLTDGNYGNIGKSHSIVEYCAPEFVGKPYKYEEEIAGYFGENTIYGLLDETLLSREIEVIGNIYENPELL